MTDFFCLVPTSAAGPLRCFFTSHSQEMILILIAFGHLLGSLTLCAVMLLRADYLRAWLGLRLPLLLLAYGLFYFSLSLTDALLPRSHARDSAVGLEIAGVSIVPCACLLLVFYYLSRHCMLPDYRRHVLYHRAVCSLAPMILFVHFLATMLAIRYGIPRQEDPDDGLSSAFGLTAIEAFYGVLCSLSCIFYMLLAILFTSKSARYNVAEDNTPVCSVRKLELQVVRGQNHRLRRAALVSLVAFSLQSCTSIIMPSSAEMVILAAIMGLAGYYALCLPFLWWKRAPPPAISLSRPLTAMNTRVAGNAGDRPLSIVCMEPREPTVETFVSVHQDCDQQSWPSPMGSREGPGASKLRRSEWSSDSRCSRSRFGHLRQHSKSLLKQLPRYSSMQSNSDSTRSGHDLESKSDDRCSSGHVVLGPAYLTRSPSAASSDDKQADSNTEGGLIPVMPPPVATTKIRKHASLHLANLATDRTTQPSLTSSADSLDSFSSYSFLGGLTPTCKKFPGSQTARGSTGGLSCVSNDEAAYPTHVLRLGTADSATTVQTFGDAVTARSTTRDSDLTQTSPALSSSSSSEEAKRPTSFYAKFRQHTQRPGLDILRPPRTAPDLSGSSDMVHDDAPRPDKPLPPILEVSDAADHPLSAPKLLYDPSRRPSALHGRRRPPRTAPERIMTLHSDLDSWRRAPTPLSPLTPLFEQHTRLAAHTSVAQRVSRYLHPPPSPRSPVAAVDRTRLSTLDHFLDPTAMGQRISTESDVASVASVASPRASSQISTRSVD